jgi:DNA-3-methyladenine glycosylase I
VSDDTVIADDRVRCSWSLGGGPSIGSAYVDYHDTVWGVPERDPRTLFEFLTLEGAQAGLSWSTILRKIDGYRAAFADFDVEAVAAFGDADVERCMADPGIVRNRGKITSTIGNARAWLELDDPVAFLWSFTGGAPLQNGWTVLDGVPAESDESRAMSKELKRRGFRFVGPTICYAFMQATGMVNDHLAECFRYDECRALA